MRVLALSSQKGGSGKTTLSGHLAVQAQLAGSGPVCLIDIDPQGSLADWWNEREAEMPAFAQTTVARLAADLEVLRQQGFKLAVIDTPPAITMAIQSVIQVAELIVIPTRPSPHDLRAVGATVDLCERAGKPLIFVVNAATPRPDHLRGRRRALAARHRRPGHLHHRTDFAASMIDGRTVMEVDPKGKSAREVEELWDYISDRLEKNFPPHRLCRAEHAAGRRSPASRRWLRPPRGWPVREGDPMAEPKSFASLSPRSWPAKARPSRPCARRAGGRASISRTSVGTTWAARRPRRSGPNMFRARSAR
jgi:chromosome partitioning protein